MAMDITFGCFDQIEKRYFCLQTNFREKQKI